MKRRPSGPRRSRSLNSFLLKTRVVALLALLAFGGAVASDLVDDGVWARHALLAGVVSSVLVVMLSAAVVNEIIERRRRQRWSVLAQYVMFELVRNARMIWSGVLQVTGLFSTTANQSESIDAGGEIVRDTDRLTTALRSTLDDPEDRAELHSEIAFLAEHSEEMLARWAGVMLNVEMYAELLDRHVELAGDLAWIVGMMDSSDPPKDTRRRRRAHSSPAIQIQSDLSSEWLADRIVVITQLAEVLDRDTLELALRVVPVEWWQGRLGTPVQSSDSRP